MWVRISGTDAREDNYEVGAVDEGMEETNDHTTPLVVGKDESLWVFHSPNVVMARKSAIFEYSEYNCGNLEYNYNGSATRKETKKVYSRGTEPRKNREKIRLYEFIISMFG